MSTAADLAADVERRIRNGDLAPGDRLDPVRRAAERHRLAPNTVAAAYRTLAERGLVVAHGRRGTFVQDRYRPMYELVHPVPDGLVNLADGLPDPAFLPDLEPVLAALGGSDTTYGDPTVDPELEASARAVLAVEGIESGPLAVTGGAVDGIERALAVYLRPGDAVAVEDPGWFPTVDLLREIGLEPVPVPVDAEGMMTKPLIDVIGRVGAVLITSRAQNPTGAALSPERAAALAAILGEYPSVLLVDDDHLGPISGASRPLLGPGLNRWAYIRSFTKALGPDLRTAVVTGDEITIGRLSARQLVGTGWVSHILQRAVASLLDSPAVARRQLEVERAYSRRRAALVGALGSRGVSIAAASGLNAWVPVADEDAAVASAREAGFAVRPGRPFRHRQGPGVRVTIARLDPEDADALAASLVGPPPAPRARMG